MGRLLWRLTATTGYLVGKAVRRIRPDFFANGGDRVEGDPREHAVCEELGIKELFGIGGGKIQSSSKLVNAIR